MKLDEALKMCYSDSKTQHIQNIFNFVREIPYEINGAYSPELLLDKWKWYCVSKHRLLKELLAAIHIKSHLVYVEFTFNEIYLPTNLINWWLADKKWYHVYLKADLNNWLINIDASFPKSYQEYYIINSERDWKTTQKITIGDKSRKEHIIENYTMERSIKHDISDIVWSEEDIKWVWLYNERMNSLNS